VQYIWLRSYLETNPQLVSRRILFEHGIVWNDITKNRNYMLQRILHNFQKSKSFRSITVAVVVVIVAAIGTYLLTSSHAASPYASATASSGSLTGNATTTSCSGASTSTCVLFNSSGGGTTGLYNGKLLGLNSSLSDLSELNNQNAYKQLNVNTVRGDLELSGSTFDDVGYSGTSAQWIDTLTGQHVVPLPLLNQYIEMSDINVPDFVTATVNWCKSYCAGGSFYTNNPSADANYAPQVLEILNEPYYGASYGYPVDNGSNGTPNDIGAYSTLMQAIRSGLNSAGFGNIGILAAANNNSGGVSGWDTDMVNNGAFAAAQGVTIHPYGPVDTSCTPSTSTSDCTVTSGDTDGTNTGGLGQLWWEHQFLDNNNLSNQANNIYITEDGWCNESINDPGCSGGQYTETQKDQNISAIINALSTTSWFKGFWYFNLIPYQDCYQGQCAYNTYGFVTPDIAPSPLSQTPAWSVFSTNAGAVGL
jgi:hypothetical protein